MIDKFYMTIGKSKQVYPVKVEVHKVRENENGEPDFKPEGFTRGRTVVGEDGSMSFELEDESYVEGNIKYEDFNQDVNGQPFVSVAITDRNTCLPIPRTYNIDRDYEGSGMGEIEYALKTERIKDLAIDSYRDEAKIVETSKDRWWEQEKVQAAFLFVGAGLFFVFIGFALGETFLKDVAERLAENTEAVNQLGNQLGQQIGGNQ